MAGFLNGRGIEMVRAKTVPLWVQEDGISKVEGDDYNDGIWFLNGRRHSTHTPMPMYVSSRGYAMLLEGAPVEIEILELISTVAAISPVRATIKASPPRGRTMRLYREQVELALMELLTNVADHAPLDTRCEISAELPSSSEILLTVWDDGPGIPTEQRHRIFAPLERAGSAGSPRGLGLGLMIVHEVAHLHGGQAWVETNEAGGATFRLLLRETS